MENELGEMVGRKVDILTRKGVEASPNYIRRKAILDSAQVIYAK
jgi:predicted nucleotidyltransferase